MGCSVTHLPEVKEKLASLLNIKLLNLSQSAGSNELQINKLHELLIDNGIDKDDIIYWQITSSIRLSDRVQKNKANEVIKIQQQKFNGPESRFYHCSFSKKNVFDDSHRIDLLCNSPMIDEESTIDVNQRLQTLLATIILLSKFIPKLLIVFGWKNIMTSSQYRIFKKYLTQFNIQYVDEFYVEYAILNKLEMQDDLHPAESAGAKFAEDVIYPKLITLKWI